MSLYCRRRVDVTVDVCTAQALQMAYSNFIHFAFNLSVLPAPFAGHVSVGRCGTGFTSDLYIMRNVLCPSGSSKIDLKLLTCDKATCSRMREAVARRKRWETQCLPLL